MLDNRIEEEGQFNAGVQRYRAVFISDIHLGTKACQAEAFRDFLKTHKASRINVVGDIVDFWRIRRGVSWPQPHNDVLQKLLREVRKGTELIYIPAITPRPCTNIAARSSAASRSSAIPCTLRPMGGAI